MADDDLSPRAPAAAGARTRERAAARSGASLPLLVAACLLAASASAVLSGCAANRVVAPRPAPPGKETFEMPEARLLLNSFHTNAANLEERYQEQTLKAAFLDTLRWRAHFAQVVDGTQRPVADDPAIVRLDVMTFAEHTRNRTIILDIPFFYPTFGIWPISPLWGECSVIVTATFTGRNGQAVQLTATGRRSYAMFLYSWYRTAPIEEAYADAYGDAFETLAVQLAREQPQMRAMLLPAPAGPAYAAVPQQPAQVAPAPVPAPAPAVAAAPLEPPRTASPLLMQPASGPTRRVAVLEFRGEANANVLALLADEARSGALAATRGQPIVVMTRESMAILLKDMGKGSECREGECEVETARNIGADFVVTGELQKIEETLFISLKLHQVQSGALLNTARVSGKTTVEVLEKVREASATLFR